MKQTLVLLKPDALERGLAGEIISRLEGQGLKIVAMKMARICESLARKHYALHEGKEFYEPLIRYMTAGPVVLTVLEGKGAVAVARSLMGPTFGPDAPPGTIRGDLGMSKRFNLIHGSDSPENAEKEIALYFAAEELQQYNLMGFDWIYDTSTGEVV